MLTYSVVLLHDNEHPYTSTAVHPRALLEHFNWELFDHFTRSPHLEPSHYHLFTYLKNWLGSQRFNKNDEYQNVAELTGGDFIDTGTQRHIM
jgi:hypothetical protein